MVVEWEVCGWREATDGTLWVRFRSNGHEFEVVARESIFLNGSGTEISIRMGQTMRVTISEPVPA